MVIQIDTREKQKAIQKILAEFNRQGVKYFTSKMYIADYMNLDNPKVVIDRKQDLNEVANNVCQDHARFRKELIRAQEAGIKIIVLVEHGNGVKSLADVIWWDNPRRHRHVRGDDGVWREEETKAIEGDKLYKIMNTIQEKYGCEFAFCEKEDTGKEIIRILTEENQ